MTENKARKRAVRKRMAKTGERYTAARSHLVKPEPPPPEPGVSDQAIRQNTGKGWQEWFAILDAWGGTSHSHREIVEYLHREHGIPGWYTQSVTVGYERARGMRALHQGLDGFFVVTVSKTVAVDIGRLFDAFVVPRQRKRWLDAGTLRVRTTQPKKSARFDFRDGNTRAVVFFIAKGRGKSTVAVSHERLPDADAVAEMRAFWKERLAALVEMLTA
jgi:uncharacterized protein YndB with AHSA1/START domain